MPDSSILSVTILLAANAVVLAAAVMVMARVRDRRIQVAQRTAAENARNAEIAAMTRGLAHEIKNPLSTVGLNAQLLREEILDSPLGQTERDRMVRRVDALAREATRLSDVLNDFLRYAGRLQLDPHDTDLGTMVQDLSDFFAPQAEQAGVTVRLSLPSKPVRAFVDESLLKQVLLNLLLNAVQAMQRLPIGAPRVLTISVARRDQRSRREPAAVELTVHDTGPGVAPELREQIFQPYVSMRPGGNGLGLATARRIVEAHGGGVAVIDREDGATFAVTLPVDGLPAATPASPSS
ncbi:MAG: HAMP domain-containing histidine kinase [Phycisphaerae bacterium]|nr:HAMP domain-containing histidine kinase [Phycisphaerae bacterium]